MIQKEKVRTRSVSLVSLICITFNSLFLLVLYLLLNKLPPIIPLFYGSPSGHDQLAKSSAIFIPTIVSLVGTLLNIIFTTKTKDSFLLAVFNWSCVFLTFLSFYTTLRIILLVGNF